MKIKSQTCVFVPLSKTGVSEQAVQDISDSSQVTFGTAARTLWRLDKLIIAMSRGWTDTKDEDILITLEKICGPATLIDLEN